MKILHFYRTYFPDTVGGVEQVIYQIARGSAVFGVETAVLTLTAKKDDTATLKIDNHLVYRTPLDFQIASTGFSASAFFRFAQLAREADVVHLHYPWPFMDIVHFVTRVKKPTVVTYHSDIIRQKRLLKIYRPLKELFLGSVDRIVATSANYCASSDTLQQYHDKTTVIPIGLDKASYQEPLADTLEKWRAWTRSRVGHRFFLFVGMIRYYKGLHILLEAVRGTNLPVVIVGSGPVETELKAQAAQFGLHNVHFVGALSDDDKIALLMLSYAFVFPSHLRSEAFGVSLLEGAMFGKPMISTDIGTGTSYINVHNKTGLVVPPNDPAVFRNAMQFLLDHPETAAEMGRQAEARYRELFTAAKMAAGYVDLYREVLHEREGR
ncbi:glycosyltransferase [Candidatus Methylospira mobilis]|uniref:Glycosyltransferase n=1 Tax=Candidatus Methylospira mobilis TaxID=1808979 RepID=A0A5Q0BK31_9GAMM|nr:glycosyltransferase family 4 protein [Candidatus Methylospira mobilis]QFY44170.1 glycosyltransferase [Candidatus Methylospira mobilis]WNV06408.1 glycosyltransferase family 4 protein [Candidatus Methylospira mobilis]